MAAPSAVPRQSAVRPWKLPRIPIVLIAPPACAHDDVQGGVVASGEAKLAFAAEQPAGGQSGVGFDPRAAPAAHGDHSGVGEVTVGAGRG